MASSLVLNSCLMSQHFDAIIIGTGQAGPPLAERFVAAGMTVAIIERNKFGGTCVNTDAYLPRRSLPVPTRLTLLAEAQNMALPKALCGSI